MPQETLSGKRIAMLLTDGVEEVEYTRPRAFLEEHGARVDLVSPKKAGETIQGFNHLTPDQTFSVEVGIADAQPADYDMLVLPGGVANPDLLRLSKDAVAFVRDFAEANKPIAAICHGPWLLIDAGLARNRNLTSWPTLQTDIRNAGGNWTDEAVVVDGGIITSRNPDDIPAFTAKIEEVLTAA